MLSSCMGTVSDYPAGNGPNRVQRVRIPPCPLITAQGIKEREESSMSEHHIEIVKIGEVRPHPNAGNPDPALRCDNLCITRIHGSFKDGSGYPVLFRKGEFKEGDRAVYVPIDSVVPDTHEWHFLAPSGVPIGSVPIGDRRIKARKMRGIFSMGILAHAPRGFEVGADVADLLGITRWEPKDPSERTCYGDNVAGPTSWIFPQYTDIEPLRRYAGLLNDGERVILREKVHGMNFRAVFDGEKLWVGSHERFKRTEGCNPWSQVARKYELESRLAKRPMHAVYGEVYGRDETKNGAQVQDLTYDASEISLVVFDVCELRADGTQRYLDDGELRAFAKQLKLPLAPVLYDGPWSLDVLVLCEGMTAIGNGSHVREGFVVRPEHERTDDRIGRVILKMIGEGYHMRPAGKNASSEDKAKRRAASDARRAERAAMRLARAIDNEILEELSVGAPA
jgi:RNA ligase (TIGR02306 family)